MKKIFILLIKYIPVIQMAGILLNNTLFYFDINNISFILDFTIGNSIITSILLYICSYLFNFCIWHRLFITANLINISIAILDTIVLLPINNLQLLITYHVVAAIFIIISTILHIKKYYDKCTSKSCKKTT